MPSSLDISNVTVRIYDSSHVSMEGFQTEAHGSPSSDRIGFFWRQAQPGMHGGLPDISFNIVLNDPSGAVGPSRSAQFDGSGARVLHIGEDDGAFTFNTSFNGTGSGEPNSPAARVFLPGVTYYANAYYFINDSGQSKDGYFYENDLQAEVGAGGDDEDNPPGEYRGIWANNPGMEFRIPDISGNYGGKTVTIDSDSSVTFHGLIEASGNAPDSSGSWSSWGTDASQVGFVWSNNNNNHILPTIGSANNISYDFPHSSWELSVPDASGFWITASTIDQGKRYWMRPWVTSQFVGEDVGGIFYSTNVSHLDADAITGQYQDASAVPFTIPNITTVLDPDISNNSATLHVSLIENGDVYGGPSGEKFQFTERGFYFDDVTPPINKYTIAPIDSLANDTSWNSLGTSIPQLDDGLEAGVPYYYQGYGHIGDNTTDGGIVGISGEIQTIQIPDISFNDYALGNASAPQNTFYGSIEAIGIGMEPSKAGFVYEINNSNHVLPKVSVGDASNIEQPYTDWGIPPIDLSGNTDDLEILLLGKRYWARSYVQDTSGVYYYPTEGSGNELQDASAAEFTFPDPSATAITGITSNSATFNAILQDNIYFHKPEIVSRGFYFDTSSSFDSPATKVQEVGDLLPGVFTWTDTPAPPLLGRTTYYVKAFVDISNNRSGTIWDISRNTYVSFTTLEDPPLIDNSGINITTNHSGAYPNSIVTFDGNQSSFGSGPDSTTELGFFYGTNTNPQNGSGTKVVSSAPVGTIGDFDGENAFNNNGIDNYVNAYAYGGGDSYYYYADGSGGSGVPNPGVKFRIPDISTNSVTLDSSYAIIASATINISGHPMDPSCVGFIFRDGSDEFPIYGMSNLYSGETPNFSTWAVGADTKTLTFDLTAEVGSVVDFQGQKFWINSYVRDASQAAAITKTGSENGTVYYAQNTTDGVEFTIPKVVTQVSSSVLGNSMTINADVIGTGYTYNSMPAITSYGFYFDTSPTPTTIHGLTSSDVPLPSGAWNFSGTGLNGRTDYYSQGFVYINGVGISGEIITTQTAADPATVTTNTALWANEGIKMRGNLTYIGTGPDTTNSWGFHLADNVAFTSAVEYDVSQNLAPSVGPFEQDVSFNDLPNGYMRGHTYYYKSYGYNPAESTNIFGTVETFIIPKVDSSGVKLISVESVVEPGSFTVKFDASVNVLPDPIGSKQGFFYSDTVTDPSNGNGTKIEENLQGSTGIFDLNGSSLEHNKTYYFNSYIFDGVNYHYSGNDGNYNTGNALTFKIPSVDTSGVNTTYDLSGDRVNLDASHSELDGFTITNYGNYIYLNGSAEEKVNTQTGVPAGRTWSFYKEPVIDILSSTLGGGSSYNANSFITIDGIDICGNPIIPFTTPEWPTLQMIDVSRNIGLTTTSGYAIMRANWTRNGNGVEIVDTTAPQGQLGFFIDDSEYPNENQKDTSPSSAIDSTVVPQTFEIDSSQNFFYMTTGTQYWINPFINRDFADDFPKSSNHTTYYEYLSNPTTKSITLARKDAGSGDFPVGFTIKIPDISNNVPLIVSGDTVRFNMNTDSSGATIDISGVDEIGFFWNINANNCYLGSGTKEIITWDKSAGDFYVDRGGFLRGTSYYYSAYGFLSTGAGFAGPRGEGIDGNDYWYSPGYVTNDSTNSSERFCIANPSCLPATNINITTADLVGKRLGDIPRPLDASYGFYYWYDGQVDASNNIEIIGPSPTTWATTELTNLHTGANYFAQPSITQSGYEILGDSVNWWLDLELCDVSLNDISVNYTNAIIDASLNTNPPAPIQDGRLINFGICWKPTDNPTIEQAIITDNFYDIESGAAGTLINASYNGTNIDISGNQTGGDDLFYNRKYSVRVYAKNQENVGQEGGGISYSAISTGSIDSSFVTLLPACTIEDPSMNYGSSSGDHFIDLSGQIINNPDDTSGNVTKYGYCLKRADPSDIFTPYETPTINDCDISTNYISSIGPPPSTNLNPPQPSNSSFKWDASLNIFNPIDIGPADLSFNRQYFIKSYAENESDYTNISDISYNIKDVSFSTPYPEPSISLGIIERLVSDAPSRGYTRTNLEIENYDPTIWGGVVEFGIIWCESGLIADPVNFTEINLPSITDASANDGLAGDGGENLAGWYKRGNRDNDPTDFQEGVGYNPGNWKNPPPPGGGGALSGYPHDASYATQGTWPIGGGALDLGIYNLLQPGSIYYDAQDPSSTPFDMSMTYYIRPYIITKSKIHTSLNVSHSFYGITRTIAFNLLPAKCETKFTLTHDYDGEGWPAGGGGTWGAPDQVTLDSAILGGEILTNPKAGEPDPSGKIIEYGFYLWIGGETAGGNGSKSNLTWPGKGVTSSAKVSETLNYFNQNTFDISINYVIGNNFDSSNNEDPFTPMLFPADSSANVPIAYANGQGVFNNTIWYAAYVRNYYDPSASAINDEEDNYTIGEICRFEQVPATSFGVDMPKPLDNNIKFNTTRVYGNILSNTNSAGEQIITGYGFCWRILESVGDQWNYITNTEDLGVNFPAPTIQDSSMVNLMITDSSNQEIVNYEPNGCFPGITDGDCSGVTQIPPQRNIEDDPWKFTYNIGGGGEELKANGGIVGPSGSVAFDISGGKLQSYYYYFVRSWVSGPKFPGSNIVDDNGEEKSGIKYGPIWYPSPPNIAARQKGWVLLTGKCPACTISNISYTDLGSFSLNLKAILLTNPEPKNLIQFGFVYIKDPSDNLLPTIENATKILLTSPLTAFTTDISNIPMNYFLTDLAPHTKYSIRAFADNRHSGEPSEEEGGLVYSPNKDTFTTAHSPPGEELIVNISNISYRTALFNGRIIRNEYDLITEHGFCWIATNDSTKPTIDNSFNNMGPFSGTGPYQYHVQGFKQSDPLNLNWGTTYNVRAWSRNPDAINQVTYSDGMKTFTTLTPGPPNMGSTIPVQIGLSGYKNPYSGLSDPFTTAIFGGSFGDSSGVETIDTYGHCWTTTENTPISNIQWDPSGGADQPSGADLTLENAEGYTSLTDFQELGVDGSFNFVSTLTGLFPSTKYYVRSYARINPTGYGNVYIFQTPDEPCVCKPVVTKSVGSSIPRSNLSSARLCSQRIQLHGYTIVENQAKTPNLLKS